MDNLPYIDSIADLQKEFESLRIKRNASKQRTIRGGRISKAERVLIHQKTDGRCHVCGIELEVESFQADHVKSHSKGGSSGVENFLPACRTCNNYRWDYLPQEFQWILKLGVWARTEIEKQTVLGKPMALRFLDLDKKREARRRSPRKNTA